MESKMAKAVAFKTTRSLVKFINDNKILKEDIVSIYIERENTILVYYGE